MRTRLTWPDPYLTCKGMCFTYGSGVGSIYDVFLRTKAIPANRSHASRKGRALGDSRLAAAPPASHAPFLWLYVFLTLGSLPPFLHNNLTTQFTSFVSQHKMCEISTWFKNPWEQRGFSPQRGWWPFQQPMLRKAPFKIFQSHYSLDHVHHTAFFFFFSLMTLLRGPHWGDFQDWLDS